jgi:hypothetical protein
MTISSEVCAVTYPGDGVNTHFDYNFIIPSASNGSGQLFLVHQDVAGVVSFIPPSEFLITGLDSSTGGTVTYPILGTPVAVGAKLTIIRGRPYTQEIAVSNQSFYPRTLEQIADYTVMQTQQLQEKVGRALSVPPGEVLTYIPSLNLRKGKVLGFDTVTGQPIAVPNGGGGGGSSNWLDLFNVPILITAIEGLAPANGKIIEFTGAGSAHLIDTPSGTVSSVNGFTGAVVLSYGDVGAAPLVHTQAYTTITNFGLGVNAALVAGANVTLSYSAGVTTINSSGGAGGSMQPVLMSTYAAIDGGGVNTANNDTAITAAEGNAQTAAYWPEGTYKTTLGVNGIADAVMTGSIGPASAVMTISAVTSGLVRIGQRVTGTGVAWNTYVVNQLTGAAGGIGTYTVSVAQTVGGGTALTMLGAMTKGYVGRGRLLTGTTLYPADFSYAIQKPSPAGTGIGVTGWYSGDIKFSDGGEYRIIGPDIRTYDTTLQYYQPTLIPHHAWFDSLSGSSGCNAYMNTTTLGGQPTVQVNNVPDASWVGKTCTISTSFSGPTIETKVIQSVNAGTKEVTFTTNIGAVFTASIAAGVMTVTAIASGVLGAKQYLTGGALLPNTYILAQLTGAPGGTGTYSVSGTVTLGATGGLNAGYNYAVAAAGSFPNLRFAPRSWNGHTYIKVKAAGGGDTYGHIVRTTMEYTPKATELGHTFMAGTVGQYGGDVNFIAGSDGTYATSTEFAAYDQGNDVAYIAHVMSFVRGNDRGGVGLPNSAGGGRVWLGLRAQSSGARAADAAFVAAGNWRYGFDTAQSFLKESTITQDPLFIGNTHIPTYSTNGAVVGKPVVITDGVNTYSGTITGIFGLGIDVTPGLNANYAAGTYVEFPEGGAILNAALKQKIVWNSRGLNVPDNTIPNLGYLRGVDNTQVFPPFWGNQQGDIETGSDNDASGDHWYTKFNGRGHSGATAKIRLYTTDFRCNVKIQSGATMEATAEMVSNSLTGVGGITGAFVAGAGSGNMLRFNNSLNRWELLKAGAVVAFW